MTLSSHHPLPSRFYPIVPDIQALERILKLGATFVQLRIKSVPIAQQKPLLQHALALCQGAGATLVINDAWEYAIDLKAPFVHLGQEDLKKADINALKNADIRFGISTHDEFELETALQTNPDYVALGAIYPTTTKAMPSAPQGVEKLALWRSKIGTLPLVAIGGITLERLPDVLAYHPDAVAVVSDIAIDDARAKQWMKILEI